MKILITTMFAGLLMIGAIISTTPSQATAGLTNIPASFPLRTIILWQRLV